ncbi:hypothetical protein GS462_11050 [Rhodococcus hoagii]|nr:hypothetical protein [Prescottella equi]MBM4650949.1 hypothetical protein [Prescottella equi]MBM4686704.1 hypothetical protein [Prescottella equi]
MPWIRCSATRRDHPTPTLPLALNAAVVTELLSVDMRTAHAAQVQRCPDGWRCLTPLEQLHLAALGIPILHVPDFSHPYPHQERSMTNTETHSEPCFSRSSVDRLRAELGPDDVVTDADLDAAMDEAAALTRPRRAHTFTPRYTPTPIPRSRVLRVVAGIIFAACVFGYAIIGIVL